MSLFDKNLIFNPNLNLAYIIQRRAKEILWWLILLGLLVFGIYGLFLLTKSNQFIFYLSLLTDMFAFYLWQRKKEDIYIIQTNALQKNTEVSLYLTNDVYKMLEKAWLLSWRKGHTSVRPIHFFSALLGQKDYKKIIKRLSVRPKKIRQKTKKIIKKSSFDKSQNSKVLPRISQELKNVFLQSYISCLENNCSQIGVLDVFAVLANEKSLIEIIFEEFGINLKQVKRVIRWRRIEKQMKKQERNFSWRKRFKPGGKLNRAMTASITPALDRVSRDWTALAKGGRFETVLGQQDKLEKIFQVFASGQVGIILVGRDKVGKKAILKKLARLMVEEKVPNFLKDKRLIELDISSLAGIISDPNKGEKYFKQIIAEINRAGNIVLVIRNIDRLIGLKTHQSGLDFSEILASGLESRGFFFVGTTSPKKYFSKIEKQLLGGLLHKIKISIPSKSLIWNILASKAVIIEKELKIVFSVDALDQAIVLADNYIYGKALTAKAIDLIVETASIVRSQRGTGVIITAEDVTNLVSQKTDIPLQETGVKEKQKLLNLEKLIHKRLVDQKEAVNAVAGAMRRSRLRSESSDKPIANFLFVGPTGVGKTQLAKTLAKVYFGNQNNMIRLDMSEYQTKQSIGRLIGSANENNKSGGYLTEIVKRKPYSLILLDEMEKAHSDVFNLFLQVMDDGRLTDASGETINFTNVILIATSNAGTKAIQEKVQQGLSYLEIGKSLKEKILLDYYAPEFLNRFDKIVLFKGLSMQDVVKIAYLFLLEFKRRLDKKGIKFEVEQEAVEELAQAGYDAMYGARPLKRVIQDKVENPIAKLYLKEEIKRRDKIILKPGLQFEIEEAEEI